MFPFQHPIIHWYSNICNTISAAHYVRYVPFSTSNFCSNSTIERRDIYVFASDSVSTFIYSLPHEHIASRSIHSLHPIHLPLYLLYLSLPLPPIPPERSRLRRRSSVNDTHIHNQTTHRYCAVCGSCGTGVRQRVQ